ncbi:transcription factor GLABRA 3-like [Tasmannia lanceolata]|uniref:transcription factor GLABRA 3-like n=1 Tax=Tasmannia lanceolata TaxID=3420 RepID=UPI004063363C
MCWAMATGLQNQEGVSGNHLKRKLSAIVRSIQWSYAVFWSISTRQQGMLEWGAGYYNGDIKTRKTVQPMELNADQLGLQRSEQLRDLYESLSTGENNQQSKRPSAALSPEDLTGLEWYYLVCMSFTFNPGQGLPGRALANGHLIWLCNAHYAESKVFTRSLLAKSASIQTVVCFPLLGGVLELGVTELILEDPTLIQHITTSFLEFPNPECSEQSASSPQKADKDEDVPLEKFNSMAECEMQSEGGPHHNTNGFLDQEIELDPDRIEELHANICEEFKTGSSDNSSNGCGPHHNTDDSFMLEGLNGHSQVQSLQFMDDEFSNCLHGSINSSDCISQSFANPEKALSSPKGEKINNQFLKELQDCNHTKFSSLDLKDDDSHYSKTLSAIFRNSHRLIVKPYFYKGSCGSSFTTWRKDLDTQKAQISASQRLLKRILFDVAWMHGSCSLKFQQEIGNKDSVWKLEGDDINANHVFSERRRREKLNEKFLILRSLIPSIDKVDKASILGDTIEYVKELERRVEELEACKESAGSDARERRKHPDIVERTSDNYGYNEIANGKKPSINKRKASDLDKVDAELNWVLSKDGLADVTVTIVDKEVMIEMRCPWRECLLLEIVDSISNLHLDVHSVQSSTADGILSLTLRSKFRGAAVASAGMIKQALQRVVG